MEYTVGMIPDLSVGPSERESYIFVINVVGQLMQRVTRWHGYQLRRATDRGIMAIKDNASATTE